MKKYAALIKKIANYQKAAIAFSGGVDSTFLARVAHDVLGKNALALTVHSSIHLRDEIKTTAALADKIGIRHLVINLAEQAISEIKDNPPDRCYWCKKQIFSKLKAAACEQGIEILADGSNADDQNDFRPGMRASAELNVQSPLLETGLTKAEIRFLSRELGLETYNKPSFCCLATRFPYGEELTADKLNLIEKSEDFLRKLGFIQFRVRFHQGMARIEVAREERSKLFDIVLMDKIAEQLKSYGFCYVTMELAGYQTGSMNRVLTAGKNSDKEEIHAGKRNL